MKKKKMVVIITQEGTTTSYETIGDNLSKELNGFVLRAVERQLREKGII